MTEMAWDVPGMRALLGEWDRFVRHDRLITSHRWSAQITHSGSVLRPPCSEEQVLAAETRLGVTFPPSYRSFLLVSNGAYANSMGANVAGDDPHGYLPVEQVDWMPKAAPDWVALWCLDDWPDRDEDRPEPGRPGDVSSFRRARRGLLISEVTERFFDILVPAESGAEWELWTTLKEGATSYCSFADQLQWQMRYRREPAPDPDQIEEYAERAANGDGGALYPLAELNRERAAAVALVLLNQTEQRWNVRANAALVLGRLTAAGAVDALEDLRNEQFPVDSNLAPYLLEARAYAGDDSAVTELRRLAAVRPVDTATRHARRALAQCGLEP